jgi:hypothetical protein
MLLTGILGYEFAVTMVGIHQIKTLDTRMKIQQN